jgi:uncharacterized phosphosugar-binding protein
MNLSLTGNYFKRLQNMLDRILDTQSDSILRAAQLVADAAEGSSNIFAFGCNHAALCTLELYYRTGGMVIINPLRGPGVTLDADPVTLTTQMERLPGYGRILVDESPLCEGDLLILHSVSGRNAVAIDAAVRAGEKRIRTVCLTNMNTSAVLPPRHESGKRLFEVCDVVIDNCGDYGDASMQLEGFPGKIAPTSTAIGAAILNAVVLEACGILAGKGIDPPVYMSSNIPGGDQYNARMMDQYRDRIHYL